MDAIQCEHLQCNFGSVQAVKEVSFNVGEGQFFALLGPNGAGKTTTLHMLSTLVLPTKGSARIMGFDVARQPHQVRQQLGMVFQDPALDERLNAAENLRIHACLYNIPPKETASAIEKALAWATLTEVGKRPVRSFSGGMKRRLELARALMHHPRVLFLDEPTVGLDPQGRQHLWERIADLRGQGLSVLMTTHYLHEAEDCDVVGIIDDGTLIAFDSPSKLKMNVLQDPSSTLEDVFLNLTGRALRDESASTRDKMLSFARRGGEHTR